MTEFSGQKFSGQNVLVMGLGLNGGGLECAKFLAKQGAELCVTDLHDASHLQTSIAELDNFVGGIHAKAVRYVLGKHEIDDFKNADLVIKNPGVPPTSKFLQAAKHIETDISLFLQNNKARLCAVTGSKGKSFTSTAIHHCLNAAHETGQKGFAGKAYIGGNITVSPLTFLDALTPNDDVVLELSSWQLGDLKNGVLKPRVALITSIMADHQDRYGNMENYVNDKRLIYKNQIDTDATIAQNDEWGKSFLAETKAAKFLYSNTELKKGIAGSYLNKDGEGIAQGVIGVLSANERSVVVPKITKVIGHHQKLNLCASSLCLLELGLGSGFIREQNAQFAGLEHRMELFFEHKGIKFYNDTAATIPQASAASLTALDHPIVITGGTDKDLDFSPFINAAANAKKIILLEGSASKKLCDGLEAAHLDYEGPFNSLSRALDASLQNASSGDCIILSPGCASFEMFLNEFDRGRKWKSEVLSKFK
ncbi:MAG: UDP-N-acetylmuramoyl-L-alanine--D-glutamate ligase [Termitinemataceae bacterium]|nr:MAG: UDP-N-acetylmuramoyl-L-alanine--D-glutamate ligase [Termitinemataceae bacterium]